MKTTYVADLNSLGYGIVKSLVYIGRVGFTEAVSIAEVVNRQSTAEQQYSLRPFARNSISKSHHMLSRTRKYLNSSKT